MSGSLLLGELDCGGISLGNGSGLLKAVEFNMAVGREVRSDTTMSSVGSSATIDSAVDGSVVDNALGDIKTTLFGVGLEVLEEVANVSCGFLGPATDGSLESLALSVSSDVTGVLSVRNNLFVLQHVLQVFDGALEVQSLHGPGDFVCVLVVSAEVRNLAFCG